MNRKALACSVLALALAAASWPAQAETVSDPDVLKGIKQTEEGDYDAAIFTLDAAARRLAADPARPADLSQAYLYLGIAFVGKGHDAAAKARFRDALTQLHNLSLSAEKYPPKVINVFEAARDEMNREAGGAKRGGKAKWLILGGVGVAAGGTALAVGGGRKGSDSGTPPTTNSFPNQVLHRFDTRDYAVVVKGNGTLEARAEWQEDGFLLKMDIVNLASPTVVLASALQTGAKATSLSIPVGPGTYRLSVQHAGNDPYADATFTLTVMHP
jgi:hypothetical protein